VTIAVWFHSPTESVLSFVITIVFTSRKSCQRCFFMVFSGNKKNILELVHRIHRINLSSVIRVHLSNHDNFSVPRVSLIERFYCGLLPPDAQSNSCNVHRKHCSHVAHCISLHIAYHSLQNWVCLLHVVTLVAWKFIKKFLTCNLLLEHFYFLWIL
jgi:hypothetical protein